MITLALAILPLLILLLGGWGIARIIAPRQTAADFAIHAALLGALFVSVTFSALGPWLSGGWLLLAVTVLALAPGLLALLRFRPSLQAMPRTAVEWVLVAVLLAEFIAIVHFAARAAIGWDGLMVWEIKARIAFANGGHLPASYFTDPTRSWSHPVYPIMLPMLETWIYAFLGGPDQYWLKPLFLVFYAAAVLLLCSGAACLTGSRTAGLLTGALLYFVPFLTVVDCNVFTGYADFPLATLYLAAAVYFIKHTRDPERYPPVLFGLYAAALPWMKQEGAILWAMLMAVAALHFIRERKAARMLPAALPGVVLIVGWHVATHVLHAIPGTEFLPLTVHNIAANASRTGTILYALYRELTLVKEWNLVWVLFPLALLALRQRCRLELLALVGVPLIVYSSIYILSTWTPYQNHIHCSFDRLISHLALLPLLTLGLALARFLPLRGSPDANRGLAVQESH